MTPTALQPKSDTSKVVRVRSYNSTGEPILEMVRSERFTGTITMNVSQGAVSSVTLEESARLTGQRD